MNRFPQLRSQRQLDREARARFYREILADAAAVACLFGSLYLALVFLPIAFQ